MSQENELPVLVCRFLSGGFVSRVALAGFISYLCGPGSFPFLSRQVVVIRLFVFVGGGLWPMSGLQGA